jgi:hypothetical protein
MDKMGGTSPNDYNTEFNITKPSPEPNAPDANIPGVIHVHFYTGGRKVAAIRWKPAGSVETNAIVGFGQDGYHFFGPVGAT